MRGVDNESRRDVRRREDLPVGLVTRGGPTAGLRAGVGVAAAAVDESEIPAADPAGQEIDVPMLAIDPWVYPRRPTAMSGPPSGSKKLARGVSADPVDPGQLDAGSVDGGRDSRSQCGRVNASGRAELAPDIPHTARDR